MYEYRAKILKVIDGDTVDVDIDLGFGVVLTDERVRMMGIDTPESRTRDKIEKKFGLASKARLKEILGNETILQTQINRNGEDMKGKFGRILGDFQIELDGETKLATQVLVEEGHAVPYFGGSKQEIKEQHMINRKRLIDEEVVIMSYDMAGVS
tara:strand:- start:1018 stop:1479 length:462 start_codon:yes stop_codon:yes gene_type:complete